LLKFYKVHVSEWLWMWIQTFSGIGRINVFKAKILSNDTNFLNNSINSIFEATKVICAARQKILPHIPHCISCNFLPWLINTFIMHSSLSFKLLKPPSYWQKIS
jgi:hypothetical protein